jgi:cell wall-associated NlpC family hydrolase
VHRLGVATLALTVVTGLGGAAAAAAAGDHTYPSKHDVRHARHQAVKAAGDVAGIQAQLVVANQRLQDAAIRAEQAAESFNGARWKLQQARRESRAAARHADIAHADVHQQRSSYAATVVSSYEQAGTLSSVSVLTGGDGISGMMTKLSSMQNAQSAMDSKYDSFRASSVLAGVAKAQADDAKARAEALATAARTARDAAESAERSANQTARATAREKSGLIAHLAALQHISVHLAEQRQAGLEQAAQEAAQQAAEQAQEASQSPSPTQQPTQQPTQHPTHAPTTAPTSDPTTTPTTTPTTAPTSAPTTAPTSAPTTTPTVAPTTVPTTAPTTAPPPPPPPAPANGADAAIAFARAQIGDPYKWGATGPNAWDCSGLTMGAWQAGGISLPHYSVAQYSESTPVSAGSLQPGDLVFWGSSSSPSSIYHVALYVGGGMIVQAPRTGQDVEEVSMYYWIPPNFYARP